MAIHVALSHITHYKYDRQVNLGPQIVRLRPAPHCRTPILNYTLRITPEKHFINWQQDPLGNFQARLTFPEKTDEFKVEVELTADMATINPFDFFLDPYANQFPFAYDPILARELKPYLEVETPGPLLQQLLAGIPRAKQASIDFLVDLNGRVGREVSYIVRLDPGVQTCEETLELKRGSCRDSAWLLVQLCRQLGLAARFVSGYLIQLTADIKPVGDGAAGPAADFTDLHAWAEVYLPGAGWVGLDATSGLLAGEGHIPLAATADPASAAPISGEVDPAEVKFDFQMKVERVFEPPRVTLPYRDPQWKDIQNLGRRIDEELVRRDVRLTMGGEPTFISNTNRDGDEWNYTALSPEKRAKGEELLRRLQPKYAPAGSLLHFGQGKWYPGEILPRWAYGCFWRVDGEPMWKNPGLIADAPPLPEPPPKKSEEDEAEEKKSAKEREKKPVIKAKAPIDPKVRAEQRALTEQAGRFLRLLAKRLGVSPEFVRPAYEDAFNYLKEERDLPYNLSELDAKTKTREDRAKLAEIFSRGLDEIVGYALPVLRDSAKTGKPWVSGLWKLRTERMMLVPGTSPMGYRLPLDSLPWAEPADLVQVVESDPMEKHEGLPVREVASGAPAEAPAEPPPPYPEVPEGKPDTSAIRTTFCLEAREGLMHVFMPPTAKLEDYLDLLTAVEATAEDMNLPVRIEGYTPPPDHRVQNFKITPDPGVIEVNLHPSASWGELTETTETLYEVARHCGLEAEKFLLDGRHVGTGGGNHVILGGPTPADSPLLRRPDLLRSLLAFWQNHPSLSYLFSGMFLGPTSQSPRIDEARNDVLYELQLAFNQVPEFGHIPPWVVDRIFRNLLTDVTGNTHRAEFCIDKLFSPDTSTGRLGLLELRAFEMPPHARMSLVQQLILRALVALFWEKPYRQNPVSWGTQLHDRFLLPYFCAQDLTDVIDFLRRSGYPFRPEWFTPHLEFRFPIQGQVTYAGVTLELRGALEPWHVLGEESSVGGTVRYVDSSVEKLQVKIDNAIEGRHVVTCNGRRVPLHATGTPGQFVAGVRYRAWQPTQALHPTIPVDSPLTFDLVDTWTSRSLGGCVYHVTSPGGRNWKTLPVNSNEAEGRRLSRFRPFGHTPGPVFVPPFPTGRVDFPLTLDLRMK